MQKRLPTIVQSSAQLPMLKINRKKEFIPVNMTFQVLEIGNAILIQNIPDGEIESQSNTCFGDVLISFQHLFQDDIQGDRESYEDFR
jgi:hypothetical protein